MKSTKTKLTQALQRLPRIDHHDEIIEQVADCELRMRLPFREEFMGRDVWGNTGTYVFSGPTLLGLADTAMYACIRGTFGEDALGIMQTITFNFLRPAKPVDLIADVQIVRKGKRTSYLEVHLYNDGDPLPICHVTAVATIRETPVPSRDRV